MSGIGWMPTRVTHGCNFDDAARNETATVRFMTGEMRAAHAIIRMESELRIRRNSAVAILLAALTFSTIVTFWTGQPDIAPAAIGATAE